MKFVRMIDENGLFVEDAFVRILTDRTIETPCPEGFIHPKWDGTQWIEGGTPSEPTPHEPTPEERLQAVEDAILSLALGGILNV